MILFEDFAPDAKEVREAVVSGSFMTYRGPDGADYTGISRFPVPQWFELLADKLGSKIEQKLSCFRLNLAGEMPHSWVHSDDICAKYASVLYLNPPEQCQGGTAFWKHKKSGQDHLLSPAELDRHNVNPQSYHRNMTAEWKVKDAWEQTGFVPMKWNRFITYPTSMFHSRFPFEGFGSGPKDGRLIWICFYDLAKA